MFWRVGVCWHVMSMQWSLARGIAGLPYLLLHGLLQFPQCVCTYWLTLLRRVHSREWVEQVTIEMKYAVAICPCLH